MAYINGNFAHFVVPHAHLNGAHLIQFDVKDLMRSAVRVGKRNTSDLMKHRQFACMEMQYKIAIIRANLLESPRNYMIKSGVYEFLDPSEKGNLSYYFGLTFAHMLAEQFLNVPWLMHLDVYRRGYGHNVQLAAGINTRPDLFGQDAAGNWYVIEAKGRSGGMNREVQTKAKIQTQTVISINGHTPTRIASVIYFARNEVRANWMDPDEVEPDAEHLNIDQNQFFENYYLPIVSVIGGVFDDSQPEERGEYYVGPIDDDLSVGLLKPVYDAYKSGRFDQIPGLLTDRGHEVTADASFGRDGTALFVGGRGLQPIEQMLPLGTALRAELLARSTELPEEQGDEE